MTAPASISSIASISREELRAKIDGGEKFFLFEVLPEMYYRKHHLPGAIHMSPKDVEATVQRVAPDRGSDIVVYCWDEH